jgi:Domain of unknown function (DUF5348)
MHMETKPTRKQPLRSFVEQYVQTHYAVTDFSIACSKTPNTTKSGLPSLASDSWEVEIDWNGDHPQRNACFTLFLEDLAGTLTITYETGALPDRISHLVPSTNCGRYALDDAETGHDLTCGDCFSIWLNNQWVAGSLHHSSLPTRKYPDPSGVYTLTGVPGLQIGYYFIANTGGICGLCAGMRIKY